MVLRLLWNLAVALFSFEFWDAWLILLLLWTHLRYPAEVFTIEEDKDTLTGER